VKDNGVPLAMAVLCVSCEYIRDIHVATCPRCGSRSVWPLAKWLAEESGKKVKT